MLGAGVEIQQPVDVIQVRQPRQDIGRVRTAREQRRHIDLQDTQLVRRVDIRRVGDRGRNVDSAVQAPAVVDSPRSREKWVVDTARGDGDVEKARFQQVAVGEGL